MTDKLRDRRRHPREGGDPAKGSSALFAFALIFVALATMLIAGCTVGPNYSRPEMDLPKSYGVPQAPVPAPQDWWKVFNDPVLDRFVEEALAANHDLKAAAERVEQARATVRVARSAQFPDAGVDASAGRTRASEKGSFPLPPEAIETSTYRAVLRASWELDFWGKYRRASEAARAELVASEAGRDAVRISLIAEVVRGYFALQAADRRIVVIERTKLGRDKALELQKMRLDAGVVSELEYRQVESDMYGTEALLPLALQERIVQEGALAVLFGRTPRQVYEAQVERGITTTPDAVEIPAGMPSDLLLRRPDVRQAEAQLEAANARIGVARAAYFPSITLTGYYGGESTSLSDLFGGPARTWNFAGGLLQPLFAGGQIRGGVELSEARTRELAELYRKSVANAFREVRDAIAAQTNQRRAYRARTDREVALARTFELSRLRYDNGTVSLFEVLETERQLLVARLDAIDAERDRRNSIVDLYVALGG